MITILILNTSSISIILYSKMYGILTEISNVTIVVRYLLSVYHGPHSVNYYEYNTIGKKKIKSIN